MKRFEGKRVIVTGAGRGIGRAIAERFASEGADVLLRRGARASRWRRRRPGDGRPGSHDRRRRRRSDDVDGSWRPRWSAGSRIDVLVNNAGIDDETPFLEMSEDDWREVIETNLTGVFLMSQRVARAMARREAAA